MPVSSGSGRAPLRRSPAAWNTDRMSGTGRGCVCVRACECERLYIDKAKGSNGKECRPQWPVRYPYASEILGR